MKLKALEKKVILKITGFREINFDPIERKFRENNDTIRVSYENGCFNDVSLEEAIRLGYEKTLHS